MAEQPPTSLQPPLPDETVATFLRLVRTGQADEVRTMLAASPQLVNAVGPHPFWGGRPQPLHMAIEGHRRDLVTLLLDHGADVNGRNDQYDHWSPLMITMDGRREDMRAELIRRGARVGLAEALMMADDAKVEELLRAGVLPAEAPNQGSMLAFARTPFAIDRLVALGAPTTMKDRWGATPIDAMSRLGARGQALVRHLVAHGVAAGPREYARLGDLDTLARLVAADPAVARDEGVMMGAVDFRHHTLVEWLLARGGNVQARSDAQSRHTALHSAAWNGDLKMVTLLLDHGASRTVRDAQYDATPLGWAQTAIDVTSNQDCAAVVAWLEKS